MDDDTLMKAGERVEDDMRCIKRMNQSINARGYQVRFQRGRPKKCVSRFFSDVAYYGADKALVAAKRWRDEMDAQVKKAGHFGMHRKKEKRGVKAKRPFKRPSAKKPSVKKTAAVNKRR